MKCQIHDSSEVVGYCKENNAFVCRTCVTSTTHKGHKEESVHDYLAHAMAAEATQFETLRAQEAKLVAGSLQFQEEIKAHKAKERGAHRELSNKLKTLYERLPRALASLTPDQGIDQAIRELCHNMQDWHNECTAASTNVADLRDIASQGSDQEQYLRVDDLHVGNGKLQELLEEKYLPLQQQQNDIVNSMKKYEESHLAAVRAVSNQLDNLRRSLKYIDPKLDLDEIEAQEQERLIPPLPLKDFSKPIVYLNPSTRKLIVYDVETKARTSPAITLLTHIPSDSQSVHTDTHIFISGGTEAGMQLTAKTYAVDLLMDMLRAIPKAHMQQAKRAHTLVPLDSDRIMSIGGMNSNYPIATCEYYSIAADTWALGPSLVIAKKHVSACLVPPGLPSGELYVFGGIVGKLPTGTIEKLDLALGPEVQWVNVEIRTNDFIPCYGVGACCTPENNIMLFGGLPSHKVLLIDPIRSEIIRQEDSDIQGDFTNSSCLCDQNKIWALGPTACLCEIDVEELKVVIHPAADP